MFMDILIDVHSGWVIRLKWLNLCGNNDGIQRKVFTLKNAGGYNVNMKKNLLCLQKSFGWEEDFAVKRASIWKFRFEDSFVLRRTYFCLYKICLRDLFLPRICCWLFSSSSFQELQALLDARKAAGLQPSQKVSSSYQKVDPRAELASLQRDKYWGKLEEDEKRRKEEEAKRSWVFCAQMGTGCSLQRKSFVRLNTCYSDFSDFLTHFTISEELFYKPGELQLYTVV